MNSANDIVENLLDLREDLDSRMAQLTQQFPNFTEQEIREFAQADPTSPKYAEYTTWICRMRRDGLWTGAGTGDVDDMRNLLTRYSAVKRKPRFTQIGGKTDITQYDNVAELRQHVDRALAADWDEAQAKSGTTAINKIAPLLLLKITNFDAAKKAAIEPGQAAPDNADFSDFIEHAGTGDLGWPWACWCTQRSNHYATYAKGPLYVVKKGKFPYVQVSFANPQLRDIKNWCLTPEVLEEIKPLFNIPEFDFVGVPRIIDESRLKNKCLTMIKGTVNRALNGYVKGDGTHIAPTATNRREVIQSLVPKIPRFYMLFVEIQNNWDNPLDERDKLIMHDIKANNRFHSYGEAEPLAEYIRTSRPQQTTAPVLESLEAFTVMFTELLKNV